MFEGNTARTRVLLMLLVDSHKHAVKKNTAHLQRGMNAGIGKVPSALLNSPSEPGRFGCCSFSASSLDLLSQFEVTRGEPTKADET